jgi:hypothetical protein
MREEKNMSHSIPGIYKLLTVAVIVVGLMGALSLFHFGETVTAANLSSRRPAPDTTATAVFQFSAANYIVGEGDGSITITVNRTNDSSGTSSVYFETGNNSYAPCNQFDGVARPGCKLIRTNGTLTFNPGDTSKTFTVLIIDDGYVQGNTVFDVALGNPVGGTLGNPNKSFVTIIDNDSVTLSPTPLRFAGNFSGSQERPANNSTAVGRGVVTLDQSLAMLSLVFSGLSSNETAASINGPAPTSASGPILATLPTSNLVSNFQVTGGSAQQLSDLRAGRDYLNVSSQNFPNGELRAQLLWNPTLEENFFVTQQYYDFFQRAPDTGGFNYWRDQIRQCGSDVQCLHDQTIGVSNAFFFEPEYQQTGAYVVRLMVELFGNNQPSPNPDTSDPILAKKIPSYDAYSFVRAEVVGGADLNQEQLAVADLAVNGPQFLAVYPANLTLDQFVDAVLNRMRTDIGVDLASQRAALINLGSRQQVIYRLANDDSQGGNGGIDNRVLIDALYNKIFVVTEYFSYLRRDGDLGGIVFWLNQVNSAPLRDVSKQHAMVCSFITSDEYQKRFGPNAPRSNQECPQ